MYVIIPTILSRIHIYHLRMHVHASSRKWRKERNARFAVIRSGGDVYADNQGCRRLIQRGTTHTPEPRYSMHSRRWCGAARRGGRVRATRVGAGNEMFYSLLRGVTPPRTGAFLIQLEILRRFRRKLMIGWKISISRTRSGVEQLDWRENRVKRYLTMNSSSVCRWMPCKVCFKVIIICL